MKGDLLISMVSHYKDTSVELSHLSCILQDVFNLAKGNIFKFLLVKKVVIAFFLLLFLFILDSTITTPLMKKWSLSYTALQNKLSALVRKRRNPIFKTFPGSFKTYSTLSQAICMLFVVSSWQSKIATVWLHFYKVIFLAPTKNTK